MKKKEKVYKTITTVYIDMELLKKSRELGMNLSKFFELKLKEWIESLEKAKPNAV